MNSDFNFWKFLAAIAVFVYAMSLIEHAVRNLAGRTFKKFLQRQSRSEVKMIAASTVVTAFLQSSSIVVLMVLSFVGTGLLQLRGALAATLGCNLGTTLSNWVIAVVGFKIDFSEVSFPVLSIALLGLLFFKKKSRLSYVTTFLIGFAMIFISLEWFKTVVDKSVEAYLGEIGQWHYLLFIPVGFLITALVQSSTVTVAISLSALYNQLIPLESAAAIVIGSELGTTLKFLLGSLRGNADKKRVAAGNSIMNLVTIVIAAALLHPLLNLIRNTMGVGDPLTGLVIFQSGINVLTVFIFYPFLGRFAGFLERMIREKSHEDLTRYIRRTAAPLPSDGLALAQNELIRLIKKCIELNKQVFKINRDKGWISGIMESESHEFTESYEKLKLLQGAILEYIAGLSRESMNDAELEKSSKLINIARHIVRSSKNLKDIRHNLQEFEATANDELHNLYHEAKGKAERFYTEFETNLNLLDSVNLDSILALQEQIRKEYDTAINGTLQSLRKGHIKELDSSTLLNVYREIYSSNKGLIRALADLQNLEE